LGLTGRFCIQLSMGETIASEAAFGHQSTSLLRAVSVLMH
jgi:hypothetical protein